MRHPLKWKASQTDFNLSNAWKRFFYSEWRGTVQAEVETMPTQVNVNKVAVRRFLLEKQRLHAEGRAKVSQTDDVLHMIEALECVQLDPVAAVERNQHLVLSARIRGYRPAALEQLLGEGRVFEFWANAACVIPMKDYPMFEVTRKQRCERLQPELDKLGSVVTDVLKRLEAEGPLPAKAFESSDKVLGYWDNTHPKTKATSYALTILHDIGRIQVVRREGTTRFFDLREQAVPQDLLDQATQMDDADARAALVDKYIRAYGVFHPGDPRFGWHRMTADERRHAVEKRVARGIIVPIHLEGVKNVYYVRSEDVDRLLIHQASSNDPWPVRVGNIRFLPPLDNLLWRRDRIVDLFDFSYTWEIYIPAAKRKFGYYAMPILAGDKLIGRMNPRLDRARQRLEIQLLQIEPGVRWTKTLRDRLFRALDAFARFHQAELGNIERVEPEDLTV